jgi:hypothetical protein
MGAPGIKFQEDPDVEAALAGPPEPAFQEDPDIEAALSQRGGNTTGGEVDPSIPPQADPGDWTSSLLAARQDDLHRNRGLDPAERFSEALVGTMAPVAKGARWAARAGLQGVNAGATGALASYRDKGDLMQALKDGGAAALMGAGLTGIGGSAVGKFGDKLAEGEARAAALEPDRSSAMLRSFGMRGSEVDKLAPWKRESLTGTADEIVGNNSRWLPGTVKELGRDAERTVGTASAQKDVLADQLDELGARVDPREVGRLLRQGKADYSPRLPIGQEKRSAIEDLASGYANAPQDVKRVGTTYNVGANEPPMPPPLPNDARNVDVFEGAGNVPPTERGLFTRRYAPNDAVPVEPPPYEPPPGDFANAPPEARGLLERNYGTPPPPPPGPPQPQGYQAMPPPLPQPAPDLRGSVTSARGEYAPNGVPFREMNLERQAAGREIPAGTPPTPANEFRRQTYGAINDAMEQGANQASPGLGSEWNAAKTTEGNARMLTEASFSAQDMAGPRPALDRGDLTNMAGGAAVGLKLGGPIGAAVGGGVGLVGGRMLEGRGMAANAAILGARQGINRAQAAVAPPVQAAGQALQQSGAPSAILSEPANPNPDQHQALRDWFQQKGVRMEDVPQQSRGNLLGNAAQQLLQTDPQSLGQYQQQIADAAGKGQEALNALIVKLETDPQFRTGPMLKMQALTGEH